MSPRAKKVYAVSPKVVRLVRRLQKKLREKPRRYEQGYFVGKKPHCGTVCCLAGHVAEMHPKFKGWERRVFSSDTPELTENALIGDDTRHAQRVAMELLEIAEDGFPNLFTGGPTETDYGGRPWPAPFAQEWADAKTKRAQVEVACRRLDHFLETGA